MRSPLLGRRLYPIITPVAQSLCSKALYQTCPTGGQLSFEGAWGVVLEPAWVVPAKTLYGSKRICKNGPVLDKEEILW